MSLVYVLLVLVVVGVILWLINTYVPMEYRIKQILNIVVIIVVIFWLLRVFGIISGGPGIRLTN